MRQADHPGSQGDAAATTEDERKPIVPSKRTRVAEPARRRAGTDSGGGVHRVDAESAPPRSPTPGEVIVINVLARNGAQFGGSDLLEAFLRNGLKFGDMNIFHRIQPASKVVQFSVASAVEPGTFDLSAMESFRDARSQLLHADAGSGRAARRL